MHQAVGVDRLDRLGDLDRHVERDGGRQLVVELEEVAQRRPLDVVHDHVEPAALVLADVVDADDPGVGEEAQAARLAQQRFVAHPVGDLDGADLAGDPVAAQHDPREPSGAEFVEDPVPLVGVHVGVDQRPAVPRNAPRGARVVDLSADSRGPDRGRPPRRRGERAARPLRAAASPRATSPRRRAAGRRPKATRRRGPASAGRRGAAGGRGPCTAAGRGSAPPIAARARPAPRGPRSPWRARRGRRPPRRRSRRSSRRRVRVPARRGSPPYRRATRPASRRTTPRRAVAPAAAFVEAGLGALPLEVVLDLGLLLADGHRIERGRLKGGARAFRRRDLRLAGHPFLAGGELPVHLVALVVQGEERDERNAARHRWLDLGGQAEAQRACGGVGHDVGRQVVGGCEDRRHLVERDHRPVGHVAHARAIGPQADQVLGAGGGHQHDRAAQDRRPIRPVGQSLDRRAHRQRHLDHIALAPLAPHLGVGRWLRARGHRLAVYSHRECVGRDPPRVPQEQREGRGLGQLHRQAAGFAEREVRVLPDHHAVRCLQHGGEVEVHVHGPLSSCRVNELAVPPRILHAGAHATPETLVRLGVDPVMSGTDRREVNVTGRLRIDRGKQMVAQGALVEIDVGGLRPGGEKLLGEAQHVVGVAGLRSLAVLEHAAEVLRVVEMLGHAVAAEGDRALPRHVLPEEAGGRVAPRVAAQRGDALEADDLRDLGVGVFPGEAILALGQRLQQLQVVEALRHLEVLPVAGDGMEVGHDFVHAAIFRAEHLLHLAVRKTRRDLDAPIAEPDQQGAGLLPARDQPRVPQPGVGLVEVVPRHPLRAHRTDVAGGDFLPQRATAGHPADVAVAIGFLAAFEFRQHKVEPAAEFAGRVVAGGDHGGQRREVVARGVAVQPAALPVAVRGFPQLEAGLAQERRQQTVGIQLQQVAAVGLDRAREWPLQQPHRSQREQLRRRTIGRLGTHSGCRSKQDHGQSDGDKSRWHAADSGITNRWCHGMKLYRNVPAGRAPRPATALRGEAIPASGRRHRDRCAALPPRPTLDRRSA